MPIRSIRCCFYAGSCVLAGDLAHLALFLQGFPIEAQDVDYGTRHHGRIRVCWCIVICGDSYIIGVRSDLSDSMERTENNKGSIP